MDARPSVTCPFQVACFRRRGDPDARTTLEGDDGTFVVDRLRDSLHERVTTPDHPDYDGRGRRSTRRSSDGRLSSSASGRRRRGRRGRGGRTTSGSRSRSAVADTASPGMRWPMARSWSTCAIGATVTVDPATRIVRVEGGALWLDVDAAAWKHHLAVVGGTVVDTGVGGLTLGGGIGWLSGLRGFTCDNLVRAELVTAAGEVVVAGPDGDPDLLWALRGGGGNFGVVTAFEFWAIDPGPSSPATSIPDLRRQAGPPPDLQALRDRSGRARADGQFGPHDEVLADGLRSASASAGRATSRRGPIPAPACEPLFRRSRTPSRRWSTPPSRT